MSTLNCLIINMSEATLLRKIIALEVELSHQMRNYLDPLETLEWLELYRTEQKRRFPSINIRWRQ